MIEIQNVTKKFNDITAVNDLTLDIDDKTIFGLIGTNGSGKSTLLRMMSGVYKLDSGTIDIDGLPVYDNPVVKSNICYLSDTAYFPQNASPESMEKLYKIFYPSFNEKKYFSLLDVLNLDKKREISTFSKGMAKQIQLLLGICTETKYLYCDELLDGLDPVIRQSVKSLFATEVIDRGMTPVIASHNLRELEDICDHIGILHKGGILLSSDLDSIKASIQKIQCVLRSQDDENKLKNELTIIESSHTGKIFSFVAKDSKEKVLASVNALDPVFCEQIPLSLEEIFIVETEVMGYDFKNLLL